MISPFSIPKASSSTFVIGPRQFVVHEAFEIIFSPLYLSSFTPITKVAVSLSFAGAEKRTFLIPLSR